MKLIKNVEQQFQSDLMEKLWSMSYTTYLTHLDIRGLTFGFLCHWPRLGGYSLQNRWCGSWLPLDLKQFSGKRKGKL